MDWLNSAKNLISSATQTVSNFLTSLSSSATPTNIVPGFTTVSGTPQTIYPQAAYNPPPILGTLATYVAGQAQPYINAANVAYNVVQNSLDPQINQMLGTAINGINSISNQVNSWIAQSNSIMAQSNNSVNLNLTGLMGQIDRLTGGMAGNIFATINGALSTYGPMIERIVKAAMPDTFPLINSSIETITRLGNQFNNFYDVFARELQEIADENNTTIIELNNEYQRSFVESQKQIIDTIFNRINEDSGVLVEETKDILTQIGDFLSEIINGLGKLPDELVKELSRLGSNFEAHLNNTIGQSFREWRDYFHGQLNSIQSLLDDIKDGDITSYTQLSERIYKLSGNSGFINFIISVASVFPVILNLVNAPSSVLSDRMRQLAIADTEFAQLSTSELSELAIRGNITIAEYLQKMSDLGFSGSNAGKIVALRRNLLDPTTVQMLYLRGTITDEQREEALKSIGYYPDDIARLKTLYDVIPPIPDLIRMTVREVFDKGQAERLGLFRNFPEDVVPFAEKQGINREWMMKYWAAHWELPSPTMGFEMFQRNIIGEPELDDLLRALDYSPVWHDKLKQLNYNPLTRVDVRRMYGLGVMNYDEIIRAYQDIGYSPENARRLADFTVKYESKSPENPGNKERDLSLSQYLKAYKRKLRNYDDTLAAIISLGYDAGEATLLIQLEDSATQLEAYPDKTSDFRDRMVKLARNSYSKRLMDFNEAKSILTQWGYTDIEADTELHYLDLEYEIKIKDSLTNYVKSAYIEKILSRTECIDFLSANGFLAGEIDRLMGELDILALMRDKRPSIADLTKWVRGGYIDLTTYIEELQGHGIADKYIPMYIAANGLNISE